MSPLYYQEESYRGCQTAVVDWVTSQMCNNAQLQTVSAEQSAPLTRSPRHVQGASLPTCLLPRPAPSCHKDVLIRH